ncbi:hypothetical protein K9B33_05945 [Sphingobium sp. 3R8]|uniref:JAB domain-containing protein n=1 Tax=Sphingobium sp. 3R8 TaxID=2874921 RepID=UPI001CCA1D5A|nr:JAB domain-containing protein [Sphingobium sp. 3R8]MBZ9647076.1 hypothetical protein [Sphingobium sp. 3R8]
MADTAVDGDRCLRLSPEEAAAEARRLKQQWITDKISRFRGLKRERLQFFFYDGDLSKPVGDIYFEGQIDQVEYDLPLVLRSALLRCGSMIVMGHNHPSGQAQPSRQDRDETRRVIAACNLLGLIMHDHFIVADSDYFSMRDAGQL